MADERQQATETYIHELFLPQDAVLETALERAQTEGLMSIQVPAELGRLLSVLVRATGARRVLELGALGGYSALHLARALPAGGRLISLELDPRHAAVARQNLEQAGFADRAEVRVGAALDLLPLLSQEQPFDLAFIDADKPSYPAYLEWCIRLVRPGGLIVADNVLSRGVVGPVEADRDAGATGIDAMNRAAATDSRLEAIILPTRGGNDGILLATVRR